jgi:hypothetical protein
MAHNAAGAGADRDAQNSGLVDSLIVQQLNRMPPASGLVPNNHELVDL